MCPTALSCHTYKVADDIYQQLAGGSIGLELTGAVARPFMLRWDQLYKDKAKKAGMTIQMYERYVDDSNQVVIVPPPGAKYDVENNKVKVDDTIVDVIECEDERTARVMMALLWNLMYQVEIQRKRWQYWIWRCG